MQFPFCDVRFVFLYLLTSEFKRWSFVMPVIDVQQTLPDENAVFKNVVLLVRKRKICTFTGRRLSLLFVIFVKNRVIVVRRPPVLFILLPRFHSICRRVVRVLLRRLCRTEQTNCLNVRCTRSVFNIIYTGIRLVIQCPHIVYGLL